MNSIFSVRRAALGVALLCCGLGAIAASNVGTIPTRVIVKYGDLDLSQPKEAAILYRRLAFAARQACDQRERLDLRLAAYANECYRAALTDAVNRVNAETLTALHRVKTARIVPG